MNQPTTLEFRNAVRQVVEVSGLHVMQSWTDNLNRSICHRYNYRVSSRSLYRRVCLQLGGVSVANIENVKNKIAAQLKSMNLVSSFKVTVRNAGDHSVYVRATCLTK
jgi:hypothetical protein